MMRIRALRLKNYRQFRDVYIKLGRKPGTDVQLFVGDNGVGKTNILNAINWCLYNDEPHLAAKSHQLPILNLRTIQESKPGENHEVLVELCVEAGDGTEVVFSRAAEYVVHNSREEPSHHATRFQVRLLEEGGDTRILTSDSAIAHVERFVPQKLREFFFFDGEKLDNYFREATGENIGDAVFRISGIELLRTVEARLEHLLRDLRTEAGQQCPNTEELRSQLEKEKVELETMKQQLHDCIREGRTTDQLVREIDGQLKQVPNVEALVAERDKLRADKDNKLLLRSELLREKQDLLFERGVIIMLWPAIIGALRIIDESRSRGEIPPSVSRALLEDSLAAGSCRICGAPLDETLRNRVLEILNQVRLSSEVASGLMTTEAVLRTRVEQGRALAEDLGRISRVLQGYESDIDQIERRLGEIDAILGRHKVEEVRELQRRLKNLRELQERTRTEKERVLARKETLEGATKELEKRHDAELGKQARGRSLRKQVRFCQGALDIVRHVKEETLESTRSTIESETKALFLRLIWKGSSFADVCIDADYSLHLFHTAGYECLGTTSAAERELLALSFILGLHQVSGFDAPILVDTPVARMASELRTRFAETLSRVSEKKQTVLLFTPTEYTTDVSKHLDSIAGARYLVTLTPDEREARVEVL